MQRNLRFITSSPSSSPNPLKKFSPTGFVSEKTNFIHAGGGDIEHDRIMVNYDGGGDGERHNNYMKSNVDGDADGDSNDVDMYSDCDVNTDSDPEGDGNVERGGVEVVWLMKSA
ncbi:hypothetical protein CASFOL_000805 [Castilleja foliolosa]|uniref:Uncharacterized protein n=1 Tax=Castilleja foliolosa TaxID=1961234 RepID=A0ABD3ELD1_9LAMI